MKQLITKVATLLLVAVVFAGAAPRALADTDLDVGNIAIVANTGGDFIMMRDGAGYQYAVLAEVGEGDIVNVVDGPIEGDDGNLWYQVEVNGTVGYIFSDFLVRRENAPRNPVRSKKATTGGGAITGNVAAQRPIASGGGYASTVSDTGGDGVRLRDGASTDAAIVLVIPEGATVRVTGDPRNGGGHHWYPVSYDGATGYVSGAFLGDGGATVQAATTAAPAPAKKAPVFESGAHVRVGGTGGADLRIRETYGLDGEIYGHAPEGAVLAVLDGPLVDGAGNTWYAVDYDGISGYASAAFLSWTDARLSSRQAAVAAAPAQAAPAVAEPAAAPAPKAEAPAPKPAPKQEAPAVQEAAPAVSGNGQAIVNVAMRYLGYAYVWGGASPSGFDCSGFTMYVVQKAIGKNIGHDLEGQLGLGVAVNAKNLQPGDLVFFQNTYKPGLSHVGIYIGGGQMINAASERTGVTISDIWNSYWGPRYVGARRI